jgi:hypothetical protein
MSSERDDRDDATGGGGEISTGGGEGGGTHGGTAIGRTTGMGAGIASGGTPSADEEDETGDNEEGDSK